MPLIVGCNKDEGSYMADAIPPGLRNVLIPEFAKIIGNGEPASYLTLLDELVPGESSNPAMRCSAKYRAMHCWHSGCGVSGSG